MKSRRRQFHKTRLARPTLRLLVLVGLLASAPVTAQTYDLSWSTIDGGGAMDSTGGTFALSGTIGQPDAQVAPVMGGGTFQLSGGFWPVTQVCYCLADMNHDGKKDGKDVQSFVGCLLAGGDCSCADTDQAGGVTVLDVPVFVADLLAGPSCP